MLYKIKMKVSRLDARTRDTHNIYIALSKLITHTYMCVNLCICVYGYGYMFINVLISLEVARTIIFHYHFI